MKKLLRVLLCLAIILVLGFGIPTLIRGIVHRKFEKNQDIETQIENNIDIEVVKINDDLIMIDDKTGNNQSTTEIPELYIEDELSLEEQEVESEAFELQGDIAYEGVEEPPTVIVGEYQGLTYYSQIDSRWKDLPYTSTGNPKQTIGSSACGPTCAAMIVSSIKGTILPPTMCDLFVQYGFRSANNGTYWSAFRWTADVFDIDYKETIYLDEACKLLKDNYYLVTACGNGLFTTGGHFIVLCGYDGEYIKVYDPYLYSGKFNTASRRGKAIVDGNSVLVTKDNFRKYANYGTFFCFKNTNVSQPVTEVVSAPVIHTYKRYVKVNTKLNVRNAPNGQVVRQLSNGEQVTVYEENGSWSRIGDSEWVSSNYLSDSGSIKNSTVGQSKRLKSNVTLYANSNLTGKTYNYLKNTKIIIKENISDTVDKVYVPATGRTAYLSSNSYIGDTVYNNGAARKQSNSLVGKTKVFKNKTLIYEHSSMSGTHYTYLPNTSVKVIEDLGNIDKVYVTKTKRYGYVYENSYK